MKNILIISAFPPNKQTAGQSFTNTLIDDLLQSGWNIDLIAFSYPGHALQRTERFRYHNIINNNRVYKYFYSLFFFWLFPIYSAKFSLRTAWFVVNNQFKYDIVYLDYGQVFIYGLLVKNKAKVFMMTHDLMIQRFSRATKNKWYHRLFTGYVYFSERVLYKNSNNIMLLSFKDKRIAERIYEIKGNAVLSKNRFRSPTHSNHCPCLKEFVFLGTWNRYENLQGLEWFIKNVYPLLNKDLAFTIIGGSFPESYRAQLPGSFKATGFVEDFTAHIHKASALISPLFLGAGIKFKVLDALSNGCRVIGTPISFEGIRLTKTGMMFTVSTPGEFADAIKFCSIHTYDPAEITQEFKRYLENYRDVTDIIEQFYLSVSL